MSAQTSSPADAVLRDLARILSPYIAAELGIEAQPGGTDARPTDPVGEQYDAAGCARYVGELSIGSLQRAQIFFGAVATDGRINSLKLAELLELGSSRAIAGALTNSLKQTARKIGAADLPWEETADGDNRTVWLDRDGIASTMVTAIDAELVRRTGTN